MPWNLPPSPPLWHATACPKSVSILSCLFTGWYGCSIGDDVFPWAPSLTTLRSFASPKAIWTYMSVFIGKNVDKPLDLGVCYFQTKSASEVGLEILSWNHQQVHWRVRYAYHKLHSLTRSFGPRWPHELIEAQQRHIATKRLQPHRTGDSQGSSQDSTDHGWNPWKNPTK